MKIACCNICFLKKLLAVVKPKKGFTLAEVLITLGIIGVVAAMTIPTIMQNIQTQQNVSALKKAYSTLSQAYTMAVQESGTPDGWGLLDDAAGALKLLNLISPNLKIAKNCANGSGCFPNKIYKKLNGEDADTQTVDTEPTSAKVRLQDGVSYSFAINSATCSNNRGSTPALASVCGLVYVDVNGDKSPNQYGVDMFNFYITNFGIIPPGTQQQSSGHTFDSTCKNIKASTATGYGCSAWVIYNENMDYLKCDNLNWDTKTKCN